MKKLLAALLSLALMLTLAPMAMALTVKDDDDVAYSVEGGSIYVDEATKTVTDADKTVTSVVIPDGIMKIGKEAFYRCTSLTSVTIPDSVTSIGESAFSRCTNLTSVTIPDSVTSIEREVFQFCTSLTSVTIPGSVTSIGRAAFSRCTNLTSVTILDSVTSIWDGVFDECTRLTSVTIPDSVVKIGEAAFWGCSSLTDIYFGGTEDQWARITGDGAGPGYDPGITTVHFNTIPVSVDDFTDVAAAYKDAVKWAVDNKYADAESTTNFGARTPCPRWEVVSILWKAMDCPEPTITSAPFTDVSTDAPYYKAVLWAYEKGITTGNSPTTFGANDTVLRRDAMTFIYRAADEPEFQAAGSFADVPAGKYYTDPIAWAYTTGIAQGTGNSNFSPNGIVTRAQMLTFLYRQLGK